MINKSLLSQEEINALLKTVVHNPEEGDIELSVRFVMAELKRTPEALISWQEGDMLPIETQVAILANNTLIAHGELVLVNDKLGVRLTEIFNKSE
ncbi:flagellar motor switch protein FliN [Legionella wadsworthii]|uniref:Flagellar motor switch protein FliN n=1 Tax=Legionella wadsworthii TaxID=28088 RepID=A0A378LPY5_9GAMM|nr:FliM/FliN family flagellar motor switch protein [Legionella wadsworthii]STY28996.1 flagellar motor switch protein FliN [Legionella wadsworthii]